MENKNYVEYYKKVYVENFCDSLILKVLPKNTISIIIDPLLGKYRSILFDNLEGEFLFQKKFF
jgi:hypothetical protein